MKKTPPSTSSERERRRWADEAFEQFWAAYPRRVAKVAARKVWDRLRPTPELLEKMLAALEWQRVQWTDPEFVPHPRTWLNHGRWDDEKPASVTLPARTRWACPHVTACANAAMCKSAKLLGRPEREKASA